jgi:hypothetical protein
MLDFNNLQGVSSKKQVKLFVTKHLQADVTHGIRRHCGKAPFGIQKNRICSVLGKKRLKRCVISVTSSV